MKSLAEAEQFVMTIGVGMPEFQPVKVAAKDLPTILLEHGGQMCVAYPLGVTIATIRE